METDEQTGWEQRVPCPDGACTGVLDARGVCGTCAREADPALAAEAAEAAARRALAGDDAHDGDARAGEGAGEARADAGADAGAAEGDGEDAREGAAPDERVPCADGACTGLVGADGRCGTCGRAAEG